MANRLEIIGSTIPVGTIITAVGPPDSTWKLCDGSVLVQATYPEYVAVANDLHPYRWTSWKKYTLTNPSGYDRKAISNMGDLVVVVGVNNLVNRSADGGETWGSNNNLPTASGTWVIENNGTRFVALQQGSTIGAYSTDGTTWTQTTAGSSSATWRIFYNGTYFLGMHYASSPDSFIYSSDGITWSTKSGKPWGASAYTLACGTDGTDFLVWASDFKLYESSDGSSWTAGTDEVYFGTEDDPYYGDSLIYFNGRWIFIYHDSSDYHHYYWNEGDPLDPDDWHFEIMPIKVMADAYAYGASYESWTTKTVNELIASVGYANLMLTTDGISWQSRDGSFYQARAMTAKEDDFLLAVSYYGDTYIDRAIYTTYVDTTHFQIPDFTVAEFPGMYKYIKMSE